MNSTDETLLRANGWSPGEGEIIGEVRRHFFANSDDFAAGRVTFFRDPEVSFAVVEFGAEEASPLATKFLAELLKVVAPPDKLLRKVARPLVHTTDTALQAIYRASSKPALYEPGTVYRPLLEYGAKFPDASDPYASAQFRAHSGPIRLDGTWLAGRSPLTVKRDELPECPDDIARQLRALVDRAVAAGELKERGPYVPSEPARPQFTYGEIDISCDPELWDAADARRNIPGSAERVRKLRREYLGREPRQGEIIRR